MINRTFDNLFSPTFLVIHLTLAFAAGICLSRPDLAPHPGLALFILALGTATLLAARSPTSPWGHLLIVLFFMFLGLWHGADALAPPRAPHHIANLIHDNQEVALVGVVHHALEHGLDRTTLVLASQSIRVPDLDIPPTQPEQRALPPFQPATGLIKLSMRGSPTQPLLPGDHVLVRGDIGPPRGFQNPGSFAVAPFLASQDIFISGWLRSPQAIIALDIAPSLMDRLRYGPQRLRAHLITFLRLQLPPEHGALYRALITGDRSGLPPPLLERFRALGIVHLLAISGLHMALLAGAVMGGSYWLLQRSETILLHLPARKIAAAAAILPLALYCLVAGMQTPALRALLMALIFISALLSDRQWHGPTNICLAALLILIINPLAINTVSFQLSFAAVTGIVCILPLARPLFMNQARSGLQNKVIHFLAGSLLVSLAASLATLPLLLYHFNRFALGGSLATIIIEPFLCIWALGWGLIAALLVPLMPSLALALFKIGGFGLDATLLLSDKLLPLAVSIWLPAPSLLQIALFYALIFLIIIIRSIPLQASAALVACLLLFLNIPTTPDHDQVTILDVGQGNSTLLETKDGMVVMVDAGGPYSSSFETGRQIIGPALWAKGIRSLDLLILSHPDLDHYSGAAFIIEHFRPKTLWVPTTQNTDPGWQEMLSIASRNRTDIRIPTAGQRFDLGDGRHLTCLSDLHLRHHPKKNDQSLVVKFTTPHHSLLMPGDIEKDGENHLLASNKDLASTVIIAPHHGSASSSSRAFLARVAPQAVIFSASRFKKDSFPHPQVQARYNDIGARSLLTSESGAITLSFQAEGAWVSTWQTTKGGPL